MSKKKRRKSVMKEKKALKAILFGDSFTKEFRPMTLERPRILLPVVNVPLIDYILEMLVCSGVKEIFIFCKENHEMIERYIAQSKWKVEDEIVILTKHVKDARSVGDFLRNVENYGVRINSDFLVVYGDIVSNINLKPIVELHQNMRKRDSLLLMTSVFLQESSFAERRRYVENDKHSVCIAFGKKIGGPVPQLIQYKNQFKDVMEIDVSKTANFEDIELRTDLIDCHIDICCPDVIEVFKENFDYKDMRNDLVKGVLTDQVISVGNTIMPVIIDSKGGYCRRVSSLRAFESISSDIVRRWMYPVVPESNFTGQTTYVLLKGNNYFEKGIVLDKLARVRSDCVIGSGSDIGPETEIESSILGRNVRIGKNVRIKNSYIWDSAVIEDGCQISNSIVMDCILREGAIIQRGCIICSHVVIGKGQSIGPFAGITVRRDDPGQDHESCAEHLRKGTFQINTKDVGEGGVGRLYNGAHSLKVHNVLGCSINEIWPLRKKWVKHSSSQEQSPGPPNKGQDENTVLSAVASPLKIPSMIEEVEGEEEDEGEYMYFYDSDDYDSEFGDDDDEGDQGTVFVNKEDREKLSFFADVREIVHRSVEKEHGEEKVYFELRSRQFAYDRTMREAAIAILQGLIFYCSEEFEKHLHELEEKKDEDNEETEGEGEEEKEKEEEEKGKWLKYFERCLEHGSGVGVNWKKFLEKYTKKEKKGMFEKELLDSLLDLVESPEGSKFEEYLENLISILFDVGIVSDHVILEWSKDVREDQVNEQNKEYSEKDKELVRNCHGLFEWLKSTEENDEENDEELKLLGDDDDADDDDDGEEEGNEGGKDDEDEDDESSGLEDEDGIEDSESEEESDLEDEDGIESEEDSD